MSKFSFSHSPFRSPSHSFVFIFFFSIQVAHIFHISHFTFPSVLLQSFSIDNVGTTGYVELSTSQKICDIGVSTDLAPEKFK